MILVEAARDPFHKRDGATSKSGVISAMGFLAVSRSSFLNPMRTFKMAVGDGRAKKTH